MVQSGMYSDSPGVQYSWIETLSSSLLWGVGSAPPARRVRIVTSSATAPSCKSMASRINVQKEHPAAADASTTFAWRETVSRPVSSIWTPSESSIGRGQRKEKPRQQEHEGGGKKVKMPREGDEQSSGLQEGRRDAERRGVRYPIRRG